MTKLILVLTFVLFSSPYEVFANVNCITVESIRSKTIDDSLTYATCPWSHSTLVSCGGVTFNALSAAFDGTFIDGDVYPPRCYAQNANGGGGVYAYARCCDFIPKNVACHYVSTQSWSGNSDDAFVTGHCGTNRYDTMLGCTAFTNWGRLDGSYPGSSAVRPDTRTAFDTHNYPAFHHCTAQNGIDGGGVKANIACCESPTYKMTCLTRVGSPAHTSSVACPSGFFMAGCSGWGLWRLNGWFIAKDICYARSDDTGDVYAAAICCRLETASPTPDPTKSPTNAPTSRPTVSPTAIPTVTPTEIPIKSPSNDPTKSPTLNPSLNPTETATFETTERQKGSSLHKQDDSSPVISGLIGALVFLSLCVCGAGLIACCLWKKRKVLKNEVPTVPMEFPMEAEGVTTSGTKRRTNGEYDTLQQKDQMEVKTVLSFSFDKKEKFNLLGDNSSDDDADLLTMGDTDMLRLTEDDEDVLPFSA